MCFLFVCFYLFFFQSQLMSNSILVSSVQHSVSCSCNLRSDPPDTSRTRVSVLFLPRCGEADQRRLPLRRYVTRQQGWGTPHAMGSHPGSARAVQVTGKHMGESPDCNFQGKGWGRQGKPASDWLVWLISEAVRYRDTPELCGTGPGWSGQGSRGLQGGT